MASKIILHQLWGKSWTPAVNRQASFRRVYSRTNNVNSSMPIPWNTRRKLITCKLRLQHVHIKFWTRQSRISNIAFGWWPACLENNSEYLWNRFVMIKSCDNPSFERNLFISLVWIVFQPQTSNEHVEHSEKSQEQAEFKSEDECLTLNFWPNYLSFAIVLFYVYVWGQRKLYWSYNTSCKKIISSNMWTIRNWNPNSISKSEFSGPQLTASCIRINVSL